MKKISVSITKNKEESMALLEGLTHIHADQAIGPDDFVLIIPNWVNDEKPNPKDGVVVGNHTLEILIKWVKALKPRRIVIGTGSGLGDTRKVMKKVGYDQIIKRQQVEFIDFNEGPYFERMINSTNIKSLKINTVVQEATKIISFTQLKQHEEATMSASIKNVMMSLPSTEEHGTPKKKTGIHEDLHHFIYSMMKQFPIHLSIISLDPLMIGTGPNNGVAIHTGCVICGNNPLSTDMIGARLLGYKEQAIHYLYLLKQDEPDAFDLEKIELHGLSLKEAEVHVSQTIYNKSACVDK